MELQGLKKDCYIRDIRPIGLLNFSRKNWNIFCLIQESKLLNF